MPRLRSALINVLISPFLNDLPSFITIWGRFTIGSSSGFYQLPVNCSINLDSEIRKRTKSFLELTKHHTLWYYGILRPLDKFCGKKSTFDIFAHTIFFKTCSILCDFEIKFLQSSPTRIHIHHYEAPSKILSHLDFVKLSIAHIARNWTRTGRSFFS